jgi:Ribulose-5-phosphate 4-epimerase and related epimerases and aldolases
MKSAGGAWRRSTPGRSSWSARTAPCSTAGWPRARAAAHRVPDPHRDHGGAAGRRLGGAHALAAANEFAALDVPLRPLDHAGSLFCYPDIPRFTLTGGLIKTRALGAALAGALGGARACLMPQHGIVAVGADAPAAVMTAVLLDRACRTQLTAMAAGPLRRWGDEEDTVAKRADVWSSRQLRAGWEYLLRRAAQIELIRAGTR